MYAGFLPVSMPAPQFAQHRRLEHDARCRRLAHLVATGRGMGRPFVSRKPSRRAAKQGRSPQGEDIRDHRAVVVLHPRADRRTGDSTRPAAARDLQPGVRPCPRRAPLSAHRAAQRCPVGGFRACRAETDLEAGVAPHRRGRPRADPVVARAVVQEFVIGNRSVVTWRRRGGSHCRRHQVPAGCRACSTSIHSFSTPRRTIPSL